MGPFVVCTDYTNILSIFRIFQPRSCCYLSVVSPTTRSSMTRGWLIGFSWNLVWSPVQTRTFQFLPIDNNDETDALCREVGSHDSWFSAHAHNILMTSSPVMTSPQVLTTWTHLITGEWLGGFSSNLVWTLTTGDYTPNLLINFRHW